MLSISTADKLFRKVSRAWRCVQLLCVWCLLSKVKVLRFNYQKMFAVGSVPWKAHPCAWALELTSQRVPAHGWGEPQDTELEDFHLMVVQSVGSCSVTPSPPL